MYTIYMHIFPNGKRYVGCTKTKLVKRFGKDGNNYRAKTIKAAIDEFGWDNIKHQVLKEKLTYEEAVKKEKYYIKKYKTSDPDFGYNTYSGGQFSNCIKSHIYKPTDNRIKWYQSMKGKSISTDVKDKIQIAHTKRLDKYILQCDEQNNIIKEWISLSQIHRELSFDKSFIRRCCIFNDSSTKYRKSYGYIWRYKKKS